MIYGSHALDFECVSLLSIQKAKVKEKTARSWVAEHHQVRHLKHPTEIS